MSKRRGAAASRTGSATAGSASTRAKIRRAAASVSPSAWNAAGSGATASKLASTRKAIMPRSGPDRRPCRTSRDRHQQRAPERQRRDQAGQRRGHDADPRLPALLANQRAAERRDLRLPAPDRGVDDELAQAAHRVRDGAAQLGADRHHAPPRPASQAPRRQRQRHPGADEAGRQHSAAAPLNRARKPTSSSVLSSAAAVGATTRR